MSMSHHATLLPCAVEDVRSRGRAHPEPEDPLRSAFELDRHRVISCTALRRVRSKTQVFSGHDGDHFRTRLTHSIEVADVARLLARQLRVNPTLAEVIALAHDLGHAPFGHAGEMVLNRMMVDHGGFEHNAHSLRVVDYLEHPFPAFRGLNLTFEVREGLIKHVTRFDHPRPTPTHPGAATLLSSGPFPPVEAQIVALADRLAYDLHDLEDAIGANYVDAAALDGCDLWRRARDACGRRIGREVRIHAVRRPMLDAMLDALVTDILDASRPRLASLTSPDDVRHRAEPVVSPSPTADARLMQLEATLSERMYRHPDVAQADRAAQVMIERVFQAYLADPSLLPPRFRNRIADQGAHRVVCDYIAGMTDRFCAAAHRKLRG